MPFLCAFFCFNITTRALSRRCHHVLSPASSYAEGAQKVWDSFGVCSFRGSSGLRIPGRNLRDNFFFGDESSASVITTRNRTPLWCAVLFLEPDRRAFTIHLMKYVTRSSRHIPSSSWTTNATDGRPCGVLAAPCRRAFQPKYHYGDIYCLNYTGV